MLKTAELCFSGKDLSAKWRENEREVAFVESTNSKKLMLFPSGPIHTWHPTPCAMQHKQMEPIIINGSVHTAYASNIKGKTNKMGARCVARPVRIRPHGSYPWVEKHEKKEAALISFCFWISWESNCTDIEKKARPPIPKSCSELESLNFTVFESSGSCRISGSVMRSLLLTLASAHLFSQHLTLTLTQNNFLKGSNRISPQIVARQKHLRLLGVLWQVSFLANFISAAPWKTS